MPPPIISVSALLSRFSITPSLSATFAPPRMVTNGRTAGFQQRRPGISALCRSDNRRQPRSHRRQRRRLSSAHGARCRMRRLRIRQQRDPSSFAELLAVLGLFRSVSCVLEKNNVAVFHFGNRCLRVLTDYAIICGETQPLCPSSSDKALCNGRKRKLRLRLALRLTEVRAEDHPAAVV